MSTTTFKRRRGARSGLIRVRRTRHGIPIDGLWTIVTRTPESLMRARRCR